MEEVNKFVHTSLTEYLKDRIVVFGNGTGNLIRIGNRSFIVTCRHVATDFFKLPFSYIILRDNHRIPKSQLCLIAQTDLNIDIAIIEIKGTYTARGVFTPSDFQLIDDFSSFDFSNTNVILCGLPSDIAQRDEEGNVYHVLMSFMTLPHKTIRQEVDYFYCEYPTVKHVVENQSVRRLKLPPAPGLSGSFILKVSQFDGTKEDFWLPSFAKVFAIQQSWDESSFVKGSNLKYLVSLFRDEIGLDFVTTADSRG